MKKRKTYQPIVENKPEFKEAGSRYLTFSNSPEEMELDNYRNWLSLSPEGRIAQATFLLENLFHDEIKKGTKNPRIIFDRI